MTRATASNIRDTIKTIVAANPPPWKIWPEGQPYGTAEAYCQAITGHSWEWLVSTVAELTADKEFLRAHRDGGEGQADGLPAPRLAWGSYLTDCCLLATSRF